MINKFSGEYAFLSNFYPCPINIGDGIVYVSAEHAYQALKTNSELERRAIAACETPGKAKRMGQKVTLRPGWGVTLKLIAMDQVLRWKFSTDSSLADKLQATSPHKLIEGNVHGDHFWGVCNGVGENNLGKLLMLLRFENEERLKGRFREEILQRKTYQ